MDASATLKVGDLARRTGLTVRTLHHYDEIGLLSPSRRTPSGHRLYGLAEVRRLQQIASLRHVGLSLDEIRRCLDRPEYTLEEVVDMQIRRLQEEMRRQRHLCDLLETLRDRVRQEGDEVSLEELARSVHATLDYGRYYTPEQREQIARRGAELGPQAIRAAQVAWQDLFAAFEEAMDKDLDPGCEEVRELARRAEELVEGFTGGDQGIRASLARMYRTEGAENVMARFGTSLRAGLWDYYGRAMKAAGYFGEEPPGQT